MFKTIVNIVKMIIKYFLIIPIIICFSPNKYDIDELRKEINDIKKW